VSETKESYCEWCGRKTTNGKTQVSETPLLENIEREINASGKRDKIWGPFSDWSKLKMDSSFEAKLLLYDELLSKIKLRTICQDCLDHDNMIYEKYYKDEIKIIDEFNNLKNE
jgi:hypothetical protein